MSTVSIGMDVVSAETIMNPILASDYDKGKSSIRSPEVITFLLSLRYSQYLHTCRLHLYCFRWQRQMCV